MTNKGGGSSLINKYLLQGTSWLHTAKSCHWVIRHMISPGWTDTGLLQVWHFPPRKAFTVSDPQTLQCSQRGALGWYEKGSFFHQPLVERLWHAQCCHRELAVNEVMSFYGKPDGRQ